MILSNVIGVLLILISSPVSSRTSLRAAASSVSPSSSRPPGQIHLLAQKNSRKVFMMGVGRDIYRYSLAALLAFVALGMTHNGWLALGISLFCIVGICIHHVFEVSALPEKQKGNQKYTGPTSWSSIANHVWTNNRLIIVILIGLLILSFLLVVLSLLCLS